MLLAGKTAVVYGGSGAIGGGVRRVRLGAHDHGLGHQHHLRHRGRRSVRIDRCQAPGSSSRALSLLGATFR